MSYREKYCYFCDEKHMVFGFFGDRQFVCPKTKKVVRKAIAERRLREKLQSYTETAREEQ